MTARSVPGSPVATAALVFPRLSYQLDALIIAPFAGIIFAHRRYRATFQNTFQTGYMFRFEYGTTNVYAQLGFSDAEEIPLKAEIVKDIAACIKAAGIPLADAAAMLGTLPSDLALALCGKFQHIRADELRGWLAGLSRRAW